MADGGADPSGFSDDFEGVTLDPSWSVLRPEAVDVTLAQGALTLTFKQSALWFNAERGVQVSKPITGDFVVTTIAHARKRTDPGAPPDATIHLAGIMARDPRSPPENYVFIVVGRDENDLSVESKTTVASVSTYDGPTWPSGDAELRLCRVGSSFKMLKRAVGGGAWVVARTEERPDLPATLAVGPNAYAYLMAGGRPDFVASFESVHFAPANSAADCER
ncbi:MAG: hypothetical protein U1E65_01905 [Myxococcota bacterium]